MTPRDPDIFEAQYLNYTVRDTWSIHIDVLVHTLGMQWSYGRDVT